MDKTISFLRPIIAPQIQPYTSSEGHCSFELLPTPTPTHPHPSPPTPTHPHPSPPTPTPTHPHPSPPTPQKIMMMMMMMIIIMIVKQFPAHYNGAAILVGNVNLVKVSQ